MTMWESVLLDLRFGLRVLRRQPAFTTVAVLTLAVGIGANTAIFSVVHAVLWRPLPFGDPDSIVAIGEERPREGRLHGPVSPADFFDWRRDGRSFAGMAAWNSTSLNMSDGPEPERLRGMAVTARFLGVLGVMPTLGREFREEEESVGRHRVVILSDGLWRRALGADAAIVGRIVMLDGRPHEIVGVLPASFWWPGSPDFLVPLALSDHDRQLRAAHFLRVVGRLAPSVPLEQGRREMGVIGRRLADANPIENAHHAPNVQPLHDVLVGDTRVALLVLVGAVTLVLLIACANVATLLLARANGRQKELAVRAAMGATRGRSIRQSVVESMLLASLGGAAGLVIAVVWTGILRTLLPVRFAVLPGVMDIGLDGPMLLAAIGASCATGLAFGAVPAGAAAGWGIGLALNAESRGGIGHARTGRFRAALVVAEVALSLVLLVSAVLLMVSFRNLTSVRPGFRPEQVTTAQLSIPPSRYPAHPQVTAFYTTVFDRLRALPGVRQVAAASAPPFTGLDARLNLEIRHRLVLPTGPVRAHPRLVSEDYFAAMGIPLIEGRPFTRRDDGTAGNVVIVNEAAARRYWPGEAPLGHQISLGEPTRWMTVVGIVGNVRHDSLDAEPQPEAYIPQAQGFTALGTMLERTMTIVLWADAEPAVLAPLIRGVVRSIDPHQPVGVVLPMDELIARSVAPRRLNYVLLATFALVAVALTAAGLYGVMAYLVGQRTREIGVRMALGATRRQVLALVLGQAGSMALAGIGIGIAGALALTRVLASLLFGVSATDPLIYTTVSGVLALVVLISVAVPSSRATRVDPIVALRGD
jgi:predicted permease